MNSDIKHRQRGTVLIVSLLILLVMTLIGVSAVSTTSLEEKMAAAFQQVEITFQATESTIETVIREGTVDDPAYITATDPLAAAAAAGVDATSTTRAYNMDPYGYLPNTTLTGTAVIVYRRQANPPGESLIVGAGQMSYIYDINANAVISATNTSSPHRQGIARLAPGG